MSNATYFVQECPICGRRLMIRVEYLGRRVVCRHCQGILIATDPSSVRVDSSEASALRRAEDLLGPGAPRRTQTADRLPR